MGDQAFKKGTYVEVTSDEEGFRGSWYIAKIIERPKLNEFLEVEYKDLVMEEDAQKKLRDRVHLSYVRPLAPAGNVGDVIKVNDAVEACLRDGWWSGVVHEDLGDGKVFLVYFDDPPHKMMFDRSDLRLHFDWVAGKWEKPPNKVITPHTTGSAQSIHTPSTLHASLSNSHQTPKSIPTQTKASATQSRKLANLDVVGALDESTLQQSMDDLRKMENEWRKRVAGLHF
ncbi:DUF724 domain-containing protein [Heracleum sosnowskyi]|uniref:DUF724 domain-containing protein n=1 Tax=Heracleum sosnowskyi TaxID=360622 RepID=A0AAD8IP41_9APIA|nr:DUF724 domain-containing protein [Heracleum sosnowskyi]